MVDKFNVSAGSTVTSEVGAQAAGENRTYYGVINMLPGVTSDAENGAIQGTRPQVNGSHFADNSVFIDGVDTSFARFGGSRVFVPTTATTEIALEAGGMSAEYGRVVGSTTNVIIKSGTNVFHGDFLYGRSDTDWNADWKDQPKLDNKEFPTTYQNPNFPVTTPRPPYPTDFLQRLPGRERPLRQLRARSRRTDRQGQGVVLRRLQRERHPEPGQDARSGDRRRQLRVRVHHRQAELPAHPAPPALGLLHRRAVEARLLPHALARSVEPDAARPGRRPRHPELELVDDDRLLPRDQARHPDLRREQVPGGADRRRATSTSTRRSRPSSRIPASPATPPAVRTGPATTSPATGTAVTTAPGTTAGSSTTASVSTSTRVTRPTSPRTWFPSENHELKFGADWQEVEWNSNVRVVDLYVGPDFSAPPARRLNCNIVFARYCVWFDRRPADVVDDGNPPETAIHPATPRSRSARSTPATASRWATTSSSTSAAASPTCRATTTSAAR